MKPVSVLLAAALSAGALCQNILTNGSFETPDAGYWTVYGPGSDLGGWLVGGVGVTHVGAFGNPPAYDGLQSVELNYLDPGDISQTLSTIPGQSYTLTFALAGQMNTGPNLKTTEVYWNESLIASPTWDRSIQLGVWEIHSYLIQATSGVATLRLRGTVAGDGGPYVDDVQVVPVPEPASLLVLSAMVFGAARIRNRRS